MEKTHTNMPIIGINPDGTVKIARKSGADVRDVKPEELARFSPTLVEEYNKFRGESAKLQRTLETGDPLKAEPTEAERKTATARDALTTVTQDALKFFRENKDENLSGFALGGKARGLRETLGFLSKKQVEAGAKLTAVTRIVAFGEEGGGKTFSPTERQLLDPLIPEVGDSEEIIVGKLESLLETTRKLRGITPEQLEQQVQAPPQQQQPTGSPLMQLLAGAQKKLGESQTLPAAGGILGGIIAGPPGAAVGATTGETLKQPLAKQVAGKRGAELLPTQKEAGQAIGKGAIAGLTDLLLIGLGKAVRPGKTVAKLRGKAAGKVTEKVSGNTIYKGLEKFAKEEALPGETKRLATLVDDAKKLFKGKEFTVQEALQKKSALWKQAFTAGGKQAKPITAKFARKGGQLFRGQVRDLSKTVGFYDDVLGFINQAPKKSRKLMWNAMKLSALGRLLRL